MTYDDGDAGGARGCSIPPGPWSSSPARGRTRVVTDAGRIRAVFFDVDFTLIHPGPTFQGAGYAEVCAAHGVAVDRGAVRGGGQGARRCRSSTTSEDPIYDHGLFIRYTAAIIEHMGGRGPRW